MKNIHKKINTIINTSASSLKRISCVSMIAAALAVLLLSSFTLSALAQSTPYTSPTVKISAISEGFVDNVEAEKGVTISGTTTGITDGSPVDLTLVNFSALSIDNISIMTISDATVQAGAWSTTLTLEQLTTLGEGNIWVFAAVQNTAGKSYLDLEFFTYQKTTLSYISNYGTVSRLVYGGSGGGGGSRRGSSGTTQTAGTSNNGNTPSNTQSNTPNQDDGEQEDEKQDDQESQKTEDTSNNDTPESNSDTPGDTPKSTQDTTPPQQTTAPALSISINAVGGDDVVDHTEDTDGIVISGTTTGAADNSPVKVTLTDKNGGSIGYKGVLVKDNAWSVTFTPKDTYRGAITVNASVYLITTKEKSTAEKRFRYIVPDIELQSVGAHVEQTTSVAVESTTCAICAKGRIIDVLADWSVSLEITHGDKTEVISILNSEGSKAGREGGAPGMWHGFIVDLSENAFVKELAANGSTVEIVASVDDADGNHVVSDLLEVTLTGTESAVEVDAEEVKKSVRNAIANAKPDALQTLIDNGATPTAENLKRAIQFYLQASIKTSDGVERKKAEREVEVQNRLAVIEKLIATGLSITMEGLEAIASETADWGDAKVSENTDLLDALNLSVTA